MKFIGSGIKELNCVFSFTRSRILLPNRDSKNGSMEPDKRK